MVGVLYGGLRAQVPLGARAGALLAPVVLIRVGMARPGLVPVGEPWRGRGQSPGAAAAAATPQRQRRLVAQRRRRLHRPAATALVAPPSSANTHTVEIAFP